MPDTSPSNSPLSQAIAWVSRITVIGLSMVLPIVLGGWIDRAYGWQLFAPLGVVLGFILAFVQLLAISKEKIPKQP